MNQGVLEHTRSFSIIPLHTTVVVSPSLGVFFWGQVQLHADTPSCTGHIPTDAITLACAPLATHYTQKPVSNKKTRCYAGFWNYLDVFKLLIGAKVRPANAT